MGWIKFSTDDENRDLYSGDAPWDRLAPALKEIARVWREATGALPARADLEDVVGRALRESGFAPKGPLLDVAPIAARQPIAVGALFTIPYGTERGQETWGRVVGRTRDGAWVVVVLARDVSTDDDLDDVAHTPWLLGPVTVTEVWFDEAIWCVRGIRAPDPSAARILRRRGTVAFGGRPAGTPGFLTLDGESADEAPLGRHCILDVFLGASQMVEALRALRGLQTWRSDLDALKVPEGIW